MSELNLEHIIKFLGMTQSSNDAEAVMFMRKANERLKAAGWDWDKLLRGKVTIIEDPFKSVPVPRRREAEPEPYNPPPQPAPEPYRYQPTPPRAARPARPATPKRPRTQRVNVTLGDLGL